MKVLVAGEYRWELYEKPLYEAFLALGYDACKFEWKQYFTSRSKPGTLIKRAEAKFRTGPSVYRLNRDLLRYAAEIRPDLIFIYQGVFCTKKTIRALKETGAAVFGYCNDDPFSEVTPKYYWKKYLNSCSEYSGLFSYRLKNIDDYRSKYGIESELLRSYYLDDRNYRTDRADERYRCDVMFIGHFEDDGRDDALLEIAAKGFSLGLYGEGWQKSRHYGKFKEIMHGEIRQLREDYNLAINSCRIALVFLSKRNNDTYTRRCFEIPAAGTFMLSEFSEDLATLFTPDKDAAFFSTADELIAQVEYYIQHDEERRMIANNGFLRVHRDGNEIKDRVGQIVNKYHSIKENDGASG